MARAIRHGQHQHMVAVAPAELHRLADLPAQVMHLLGRDAHEIQRPGIGEAIVIKPRAEPDRVVYVAGQHLLFDQVLDDDIDGGKRRADRLGDGVGTGRRACLIKMVDDLQRPVDTADAAAAARLFSLLPRQGIGTGDGADSLR